MMNGVPDLTRVTQKPQHITMPMIWQYDQSSVLNDDGKPVYLTVPVGSPLGLPQPGDQLKIMGVNTYLIVIARIWDATQPAPLVLMVEAGLTY